MGKHGTPKYGTNDFLPFSWIFKLIGNPLEWSGIDKCLALSCITLIAVGVHLPMDYFALYFHENFPYVDPLGMKWVVRLEILSCTISGLIVALCLRLRRRKQESSLLTHASIQNAVISSTVFTYYFGAFTSSLAINFFGGMLMVFLLFDLGSALRGLGSSAVIFLGTTIAERFGFLAYAPSLDGPVIMDGHLLNWWFIKSLFNYLVCALAIVCSFVYIITVWRDREAQLALAYQRLHEEQERSERLLLNILPKPIAQRLKKETGTIADGFDSATVLFADIVGFTRMASNAEPRQVVHLLNKIFSRFDDLAMKHGLEKIKTIGDGYMAVSGVPEKKSDHAEAAAKMALEMLTVLEDFNKGEEDQFGVRIGLHTGPVVAGVIGKTKFAYDLWGDTVNTASRMESHGIEGAIQVTNAAYEQLKGGFDFDPRGPVEVKGKGAMETFLLKGAKTETRI